jgi:hypothetical protein
METKDELIQNIKEWVKIDSEMKALQKELRDRREKKKELTNNLVDVMKTNEIDCFNINNGKLIYSQNKIKGPVNKKHLISCLVKYFDDDQETAEEISKYIMDTREIKIKETIRRKLPKNINT